MPRLPALIILFLILHNPAGSYAENEFKYAEISAIFAKHCVICHAGAAAPMGLRLDSLQAIMQGSDRGAVVKAGQALESVLIKRIKGEVLPRMPMTGPPFLSDKEVASIEGWINAGLPAGDSQTTAESSTRKKTADSGEKPTYLQVAPIFATRCAKCHSENGLMGSAPEGFVLTSYQSTLDASERARVVPGNPGASELIRRIRGQSRPQMPLDGPPYLQQSEIDLIVQWIAEGALNSEAKPAPIISGSRVRLEGTLTAADRLDGLKLIIGKDTRIDKNPSVGSYVQVRGRIDPSGQVLVERLRRR